jgi:hypothetical protein
MAHATELAPVKRHHREAAVRKLLPNTTERSWVWTDYVIKGDSTAPQLRDIHAEAQRLADEEAAQAPAPARAQATPEPQHMAAPSPGAQSSTPTRHGDVELLESIIRRAAHGTVRYDEVSSALQALGRLDRDDYPRPGT